MSRDCASQRQLRPLLEQPQQDNSSAPARRSCAMADLGAVPEDELLEGEYDDLPEFANDENRALHRQVRPRR